MVIRKLFSKFTLYWALIKSPQTGLLILTGIAGYSSAHCPALHWLTILLLCGSLFMAISGSTILNMVFDRDIDSVMKRTAQRPIPAGLVSAREALVIGLIVAVIGIAWSVAINPLYGLIVFAGVFFNTVVYTLWLKRRTPWSIVWGGIAGAMPILAGRVLGTGQFDLVGLLLAMAVLFWIPTHIITFSFRQAEDYKKAGVPVFPNCYGERTAHLIISLSTAIAAFSMVTATGFIGLEWGYLRVILSLSILLVTFAVVSMLRHSGKFSFALFRMASFYMLITMVVIIAGVWSSLANI